MRLDVYLSTQGLCDSRARAQDAIQEGRVTVNGRIAKKSSMPVDDSMDIKLEDEISREAILEKMNPCMPDGITVFDVTDPVMKPGAIAFGQYRIELFCGETTPEALLETVKGQLEKKELIIEKRSKKGVKLFDLKPAVQKAELFLDESGVVLETILPAGSTLNVNPSLLVEAFCLYTKLPVEARITRENVLDQNLKSFR